MSELAELRNDGRHKGAAVLTLVREGQRNALSLDLLAALHARVDELAGRREITVLVITGAGKSFCAGMDLKQVIGEGGTPLKLLTSLAELTLKIRALPMVTVAKVNGAAIGGGCGLVCVCDMAVTHADSKMGFPEVDLGICPAVVAPWLVRRIGAGQARRVLLEGGVMSGQRAHEIGIVTELCPTRAELDRRTDELVARLVTGGARAVRATKQILNELDGSLNRAEVMKGAEISAAVVSDPGVRAALRERFGGD